MAGIWGPGVDRLAQGQAAQQSPATAMTLAVLERELPGLVSKHQSISSLILDFVLAPARGGGWEDGGVREWGS